MSFILNNPEVCEILKQINKDANDYFQQYYKDNPQIPKKESPLSVVIKPELLDTSNLKEGEGNKTLIRPQDFSEYIGQEEAKARIIDYIQGCKKFNEKFCHTLITAPSGCGKTTLALIMANMMKEKFVITTAGEVKSAQQMLDKIAEADGGWIFLDEAHRINNKVGTFLLPILEDFQVQGKKIKPFTMILGTTHVGNIAKNLEALLQRFPLQINLKPYNQNELISILKQYKQKRYVSVLVPDSVYYEIAKNARITPRIALTLLKEYIYTQDWQRVLTNNQIVKDGITQTDIKVLKYLSSTNGAGKASIAKYLRIEPNTYEYSIENYLIHKEFITVESKRKITNKGKDFLIELK